MNIKELEVMANKTYNIKEGTKGFLEKNLYYYSPWGSGHIKKGREFIIEEVTYKKVKLFFGNCSLWVSHDKLLEVYTVDKPEKSFEWGY